MVDIRLVQKFKRPIPLDELRRVSGLKRMELLRRGSRLSVQPVRADEWSRVVALAGTKK
jgi:predicted RNA-binding protein with PUA-like domain